MTTVTNTVWVKSRNILLLTLIKLNLFLELKTTEQVQVIGYTAHQIISFTKAQNKESRLMNKDSTHLISSHFRTSRVVMIYSQLRDFNSMD